jgi:hypothetical protein
LLVACRAFLCFCSMRRSAHDGIPKSSGIQILAKGMNCVETLERLSKREYISVRSPRAFKSGQN